MKDIYKIILGLGVSSSLLVVASGGFEVFYSLLCLAALSFVIVVSICFVGIGYIYTSAFIKNLINPVIDVSNLLDPYEQRVVNSQNRGFTLAIICGVIIGYYANS